MTEYKHSLGMLALLVSSPPDKRTVFGRALDQLVHDVEGRGVSVLASESLTDAASIRDVLLFPYMRPEAS